MHFFFLLQIFVPMLTDGHWVLAVLDRDKSEALIYDSLMGFTNVNATVTTVVIY